MSRTALAIHGGAGTLLKKDMTEEKEQKYRIALAEALQCGEDVLTKGGSAMDAVEASVMSMEDSPLFNAGRGSVFTAEGTHEMDASIMSGIDRTAGAVSGVDGVRNPISLARAVIEHTEHVMLSGQGAQDFAASIGARMEDADYFHDDLRYAQWQQVKGTDTVALDHNIDVDRKFGTVGAVALDSAGHIAAATSTGGMTNKRYGRVGDSPIIGCGTYAEDKTCAVSCTGSGEYFIRGVVAYRVSALMELNAMTLAEACTEVVHTHLPAIHGDGGLIAIDAQGNIVLDFNTEGMYRAWMDVDGVKGVEIYGR